MAGHTNPAGKTEDFRCIIFMYFSLQLWHMNRQFIWVTKEKKNL